MTAIELRRKRARLIESDARAILQTAHDEDREMTKEERERFDAIHAEAARLLEDIERIERQEAEETQLRETIREELESAPNQRTVSGDPGEVQACRNAAFSRYIRGGAGALTAEQRAALGRPVADDAPLAASERAQTVTTTGGGYLIAEDFASRLDAAMAYYGGVIESGAEVMTTATGAPLPYPTVDDTSNQGRKLDINTAGTEQDLTFGVVNFGAYKYSSDIVRVPEELLQDSEFDVDSMLTERLAERLGRIRNSALTTGDGSGDPNGVLTAAVDSSVNIDISDGLTLANMVALEHSVDRAYRNTGPAMRCGWQMHDTFLEQVKTVVDGLGRPVFRAASEAAGQVDTVLGYPVTVNNDLEAWGTATNKPVIFGAMYKYKVRIVRGFTMLRLVERYAEFHQVGFLAFQRMDGNLIDAGTNPIKFADLVA